MNRLYYGDNLAVLREHIANASVDLVYLDPPFNSKASYNVLYRAPSGARSCAQVEAFEDTWHWNDTSEQAFDEVMRGDNADAAEMLRAIRAFLRENDMMAYLAMMAVRLLELHRALKPTGSLYLHCDPTASHYLKILLDAIFGKEKLRNEIVWKRTFSHGSSRRFGPVHDIIFYYSKTQQFTWFEARDSHNEDYVEGHYRLTDEATGRRFQAITLTGSGTRHGESGKPWRGVDPSRVGRHWALPGKVLRKVAITGGSIQDKLDALDALGLIYWPEKTGGTPRLKAFADELDGAALPDVWTDIAPIAAQARERLGYPTQKPTALLERIIRASTNPGDVVLDPFCGCGTAIHAAQGLGRRWLGIDVTHLAIALIERRLQDAFPGVAYEVVGTPKDLDGARALAAADKYQFQWWALSLLKAVPFAGRRRGADGGVDGLIYFRPDGRRVEKAIVSVKGGEIVGVGMIRDLVAVLEREQAPIGVFLTLTPPTKAMRDAAVVAGFHETAYGRYRRVQILTIEDALGGTKPDIPLVDAGGIGKDRRSRPEPAAQPALL